MFCEHCKGPMKPLFGAKWFCPQDCDLRPAASARPTIHVVTGKNGKRYETFLVTAESAESFRPARPGDRGWWAASPMMRDLTDLSELWRAALGEGIDPNPGARPGWGANDGALLQCRDSKKGSGYEKLLLLREIP